MSANTPQPIDLNASLSSLAMLSVQLREGKDYLDYIHGFVVDAISRVGDEPFDAATVKKIVEEQFALRIPAATFTLYLKRLAKTGSIRSTSSGLQFQVVKLPATSVERDRDATRIRIKEVTDELAGFAYTRYSLTWDERSSALALAEFLRQYSIDFLKFSEARSPLPITESRNEHADFVVASFVANSAKERTEVFESIRVLVQSHILANALMCPDLEQNAKGFRSVIFLADTRFLIKALDLESTYDTDNARQLLAAIKILKGVVCVFQETKDELRGVLKAVIRGMQNGGGRGPIYRELLKRRRGVGDVILADNRLDETLAGLSVTLLQSPRYDESNFKFQIDEEQLREEIQEEIDYISDKAADHDTRVVRHIYALRKDRRPSSIEECCYVLLTTNSALSRAAFQYEKSLGKGWFFSTVVTDYHLSHLAWLKSPMQSPELPRAEILANCYATMRPPEAFWNRYLGELERLKSEKKFSARDHEVLRLSLNAPDELMEVTRGEVDGLSAANLHKILEKLEKTYAQEKQQELLRERTEHERTKQALAAFEKTSAERDLERVRAAVRESDLEMKRFAAEQEVKNLKDRESAAKVIDQVRQDRINRIAEQVSKIAFYMSGLVFAAIGVLSLFGNVSIWFGVPAAVIGFFNLWSGFSGNTVEKAVKRWIAAKLASFIG